MYEELVKALRETRERVRQHTEVAMSAPPYQLSAAAEAIEELSQVIDAIPHVCECCIGCEVESGSCCRCFVLSPKRAMEYLNKSRWIPVTERLPEHEYGESTSVLTVDLYGIMRVAYFDGGNWCSPSGEALTTIRVAPITHWMPLPEPPKEG